MQFQDFAQKLYATLGEGESTARFTKTLFLEIVSRDGEGIIEDGYKDLTFKSFYNGSSPISRISKKINIHVNPNIFKQYINEHSTSVRKTLCNDFTELFPDATSRDIGEHLANLFQEIIVNATKNNNNDTLSSSSQTKKTSNSSTQRTKAPDTGATCSKDEENKFSYYIEKAKKHYSVRKSLLYAEAPHPFSRMYVCNNIEPDDQSRDDERDESMTDSKVIEEATIPKLVTKYKYVIIKGTGGIGKTMFLTHLLLDYKQDSSKKIPVLIYLKDFSEPGTSIIRLAIRAIQAFDPSVSGDDVYKAAREGKLIFLLDGLDEIKTCMRDNFTIAIDNFTKAYPSNTIIMSSRPTNSFIEFHKFALFSLLPLTKIQADRLIRKLEFWDTVSKERFLVELDKKLYESHYQFASNPLLLTIMLMTFSSYGEIPAKMHHFYAQAYLTMARLHDATKGCYVRDLHTGLKPEEFADVFSEFCARTYFDEEFEFELDKFTYYMKGVLQNANESYKKASPHDYLLDLTDNLCLMYREGEKIYFIHRSFQEYFAAVYFANNYDEKLFRVGKYFEEHKQRTSGDLSFDMLCDMIPEKAERYIFLPLLDKLFSDKKKSSEDEYWFFLEKMYPVLHYSDGFPPGSFINEPESFIYKKIVRYKKLVKYYRVNDYNWHNTIYAWPTTTQYCYAYLDFLSRGIYDVYKNPDEIPEYLLNDIDYIDISKLPPEYFDYFGRPKIEGTAVNLDIRKLRRKANEYPEIVYEIMSPEFPLKREYLGVKEYYEKLKERVHRLESSNSLFDD